MAISPKELKRRARLSPLWWFSVFSRILNKARDLVIPEPNICQIRLCEAYEWAVANNIPFRCIVVKPRQIGISTLCAGIAYWIMRLRSVFCVIMADDLDRSDKLFEIMKRFAEKDQFPWEDGRIPIMTADDLTIGPSIAEKKTANRPTATRGGTPQVVIATEAAFYPNGGVLDASETMTALLNSVPNQPGTVVIIESTAKGMSGYFAEMWSNAKWPSYDDYWKKYIDGAEQGKSVYIRVFVAWWEIQEYKMKVTPEEIDEIRGSLVADERELVAHWETIGFTSEVWERLKWRRFTIMNSCKNSVVKFREEYPSSPNDPFTVSGSPVFDPDGLTYLHRISASSNFKQGSLSDARGEGDRPIFIPGPSGSWLRLFELPKVGCKYIVAGDVATDADINPAKSSETKRDCHSFGVFRVGFADDQNNYFRPRLVGRLLPDCRDGHDLLASKLHLMSKFFGDCPIAPEINNTGGALIKTLLSIQAPVFSRTHTEPETQKQHVVYGWNTDQVTRKEIVEHLASSIRRIEKPDQLDCLEILDADAVAQLRTFILNRKGKAEAASTHHDDDVLMLCIGYYLLNGATTYLERVVPRYMPKWDYRAAADKKTNPTESPMI